MQIAQRLYQRLGYRATGEQRQVTYTYLDDHGHERQATELEIALNKTDLPR
ncbi:hypothetical protein OVA26_17045 [Microbacterium sp. SL62]|uniref:hypothetical protein n=1 Tax=Microbacterium sp. SL62 TaxID=2995139 RepID=UPI0022763545|nr:hypothetical protein [Microbacterium sp. SL62]MCY1718647.1 hypothetical protein [Microbacterium sp. SL62]